MPTMLPVYPRSAKGGVVRPAAAPVAASKADAEKGTVVAALLRGMTLGADQDPDKKRAWVD